jgi:hypothetical protein
MRHETRGRGSLLHHPATAESRDSTIRRCYSRKVTTESAESRAFEGAHKAATSGRLSPPAQRSGAFSAVARIEASRVAGPSASVAEPPHDINFAPAAIN